MSVPPAEWSSDEVCCSLLCPRCSGQYQPCIKPVEHQQFPRGLFVTWKILSSCAVAVGALGYFQQYLEINFSVMICVL